MHEKLLKQQHHSNPLVGFGFQFSPANHTDALQQRGAVYGGDSLVEFWCVLHFSVKMGDSDQPATETPKKLVWGSFCDAELWTVFMQF